MAHRQRGALPAVVGPGIEVHANLGRAVRGLDEPHQRGGGCPRADRGRAEVVDHEGTVGGLDVVPQDVGVGLVAAVHPLGPHAGHREAAAVLVVEQPAEHRGGVEAREAKPLHVGARRADQREHLPVAHQRVIEDVGHRKRPAVPRYR
jgi:hypothetical protein